MREMERFLQTPAEEYFLPLSGKTAALQTVPAGHEGATTGVLQSPGGA